MSESVTATNPGPHPSAGSSLTLRTFAGFFWTMGGSGLQAVLKLLVLAVLARLLAPAEFGIVSAALTVVALAELFGQIGVAPAIIQAPELDARKIRTGSTVTILAGFAAGAALLALAPLMAGLFHMPEVEQIIQVFALVFVISGFAVVPEALLQRRMRFRALALVVLVSYLFGYAVIGISLAFAGFGIWALVWANIGQYVIKSVAHLVLARAPMMPLIDGQAFRQLFRFGAGVTLSRLGNYVALNADYVVVGRWMGAEALGFYSRAYVLLVQPAQLVGSAAEKVLYPALSAVQSENERLLRGYYRATALIALTNLPVTALLFVLAPQIIHLLLGPQWDAAIVPFQILVLSLVFRTAYKMTGTLLRARGTVYLLALWQWLYAAMVIAGALSGLRWGLAGVATGVSLAILGAYWVGVFLTSVSAGTRPLTNALILARHGTIALALGSLLLPLRNLMIASGLHEIVTVAGCTAAAGLAYLAIWFGVPRLFGEEGVWLRALIYPRLGKLVGRQMR